LRHAEGNREGERTFHDANEVEKIHAQLYQNLLDSLGAAQETYPYYVCPVCGYTSAKEALIRVLCVEPGARRSRR